VKDGIVIGGGASDDQVKPSENLDKVSKNIVDKKMWKENSRSPIMRC